MKKLVVSVIFFVGLNLLAQSQSIPHLLNFQGLLRTDSGSVANGEFDLTFKIYDSQMEGNLLWEETHTNVSVKNGFFNVVLGSITPFPDGFFDTNRNLWIGISVGENGVEFPRKKLLSVAFSFQAEKSDVSETSNSLSCEGCVDMPKLADDVMEKLNNAATKSELSDLEANLTSQIEDVQSSVDSLSSDLEGFKATTNGKLNDLENGLGELSDSFNTLSSQFNDFKSTTSDSITSLQSDVDSLTSSVNDLNTSVEGIISNLENLTDTVNSNTTKIDDHINNSEIHKTPKEIFDDIVANYDGEGSGLDADTVDGYHASDLLVKEHLIRNGSFEKELLYWNVEPEDETAPVLDTVDNGGQVKTGVYSVKLYNDKKVNVEQKMLIYGEFIPVSENEKINFKFSYFGESDIYNNVTGQFFTAMAMFDKKFDMISVNYLDDITIDPIGQGSWKDYEKTITIPVDQGVMYVIFVIGLNYDGDRNFKIWVDDIDATSDSKNFYRLNSYAGSNAPGGPALALECDGCIHNNQIAEEAIDTIRIANNTILGEDIAFEQITTDHIVDGTISGNDLGSGIIEDKHIGSSAGINPAKIKGTAATLTGTQNFDSGTLYIDAENNVVGIGTTNPSYKLEVNGNVMVHGGINITGNNKLYFQSYGGGWYMDDTKWIKNYGKKGIYVDTPSYINGLQIGTIDNNLWGGWHKAIEFTDSQHAMIYFKNAQLGFGMHSNGSFYWADMGNEKYFMSLDNDALNVNVPIKLSNQKEFTCNDWYSSKTCNIGTGYTFCALTRVNSHSSYSATQCQVYLANGNTWKIYANRAYCTVRCF